MSEDQMASRIGDYEILGVLGAGGMGKVYKVRNVLSDRVEAMKVLLPNLVDQKDLADRFLREIKVLAGLNHPNIAAMHTALTINNQLVMIMEFVEGTTLADRVEQGATPCGEAVNFISQVLSALSYAHQQQVIHRDIKPANMMLTPAGVIKLMDFGIARSGRELNLTQTGTTLGSIAYMSPEQITCQPIDARSDLYSVGISFYELVTGQKPFQADSNFSIMKSHLQDLPKRPIDLRPDLPEAVSKIILMALEKDPTNRFQSADAFRNALLSVAADLGVTSPVTQVFSAGPVNPDAATVRQVSGLTPTPVPRAVPPSAAPPAQAPRVAPVAQVSPTQVAPAAQMPPPQARPGGNRGLYITLGALLVVAILVVAGSMPRLLGTRANEGSSSPPKTSTPSPAKDTAPPPANPPAVETPQPEPAAPAAPAPTPQPSHPAGQQQPKAEAPAPPPGPDPAEIAALDDEIDQLSSRSAAVRTSIENLQRQQAAQGLGLRGDILEAQQLAQAYLAKAQAAVQAQDVKSARKYIDMTNRQVEKIEKFLGR
jgi:serine/threonine-protein kinase